MDVVGWATIALAVATFILAGITAWSVRSQNAAVKRGFEFERVRQVPTVAPLITLRIGTNNASNPLLAPGGWYVVLTNSGAGAACNPRLSGQLNGRALPEQAMPAIGPMSSFLSSIAVTTGTGTYEFKELIIRYDDVFGNHYSTEYSVFDPSHSDYIWRRPWIGKDFDVPQPVHDSANAPEWGR